MRALLLSKDGRLHLKQKATPRPRSNEAILKVRKTGICGTDLAIESGDYKVKHPLVLGHEIFGEVERTSPASRSFIIGSRVTTEINVSCGSCPLCETGLRNHCANIRTIGINRDGGFADFVSAPIENLHLIPDSISDEEAVFVEPLAAAIELTKMSAIQTDSTIAIIGIGRLGLLILQVLKLYDPKLLIAVAHHKGKNRKTELARKFGADEIFFSDDDEITKIQKQTRGVGFDHVIEATGTPAGVGLALKLVRPRGTIHMKSTHGLSVNFDFTKLVVKEVRIQGSRCGPFEEAIKMIQSKKVSTKELVTGRFSLEEFTKAFAGARDSNAIKVIFEM
jgi:alcohol dehydrogenase